MVALEGLSDTGKTTILQMLRDKLWELGFSVRTVDIDQVTSDSERSLLKRLSAEDPMRIATLWVLRFKQHEAMLRLSRYANVDVVLSDRSLATVVAMDVFGGNRLPKAFLRDIVRRTRYKPDITFFLDAPVEVVRKRGASETTRDADFAERVREGYRSLARKRSWITVDATKSKEKIMEVCLEFILQKLKGRPRE